MSKKSVMSDFLTTKTETLLGKALDFRSQRHDLLASNIANKDTPNYKAEDMVFEGQLKAALHADQPGPLNTRHARHLDGNNAPSLELVQARRINSAAPFVDFNGNSVDIDREMAKIAENQLMYNATTRMMGHHFKMLKTAMAEGQ